MVLLSSNAKCSALCIFRSRIPWLKCALPSVEFRLIVFRPFKGEIIEGKISGSDHEGIKSTTPQCSTLASQAYLTVW